MVKEAVKEVGYMSYSYLVPPHVPHPLDLICWMFFMLSLHINIDMQCFFSFLDDKWAIFISHLLRKCFYG